MCGGIFFKLLAIAAIEICSNMRFTVEMYRRMAGSSSNREISPEIGKIEILYCKYVIEFSSNYA